MAYIDGYVILRHPVCTPTIFPAVLITVASPKKNMEFWGGFEFSSEIYLMLPGNRK